MKVKEIQKLMIVLGLLSPFCESLKPTDFCKLTEKDRCSRRYSPYIYQCGNLCAGNEAACQKYSNVEKIMRKIQLIKMTELVSPRIFESESTLDTELKRFQTEIEECQPTKFEWQPIDVCVRERDCIKISGKASKSRKNCPCPKSLPYVCGNKRNYCATDKKACDSFNLTYKNRNSFDRFQLLDIEKC